MPGRERGARKEPSRGSPRRTAARGRGARRAERSGGGRLRERANGAGPSETDPRRRRSADDGPLAVARTRRDGFKAEERAQCVESRFAESKGDRSWGRCPPAAASPLSRQSTSGAAKPGPVAALLAGKVLDRDIQRGTRRAPRVSLPTGGPPYPPTIGLRVLRTRGGSDTIGRERAEQAGEGTETHYLRNVNFKFREGSLNLCLLGRQRRRPVDPSTPLISP